MFSSEGVFRLLEHLVFIFVIAWLLQIFLRRGTSSLLFGLFNFFKETIPGFHILVKHVLKKEVTGFVKQLGGKTEESKSRKPCVTIPKTGVGREALLEEVQKLKTDDNSTKQERLFAYVYTIENESLQIQGEMFDMFAEKTGLSENHDTVMKEMYHAFMHENALNPIIFPALRKFETETISMTAAMLHGDGHVVGSLTSGGTESILMAVKAYRDRARKLFPHIKEPNIVAPITIHPAFEKAAHYFGLNVIHVPIDENFQVKVNELEKSITPNTILLAASAPQYCHGAVDPIPQLSELAVKRGLPLHIDACFGGFMLPWIERLGYPVPQWDFRLPGVMSVTVDLHKYGFALKGASVVLYRDEELRKYQFFAYSGWPGGLFGSPSMSGSRPGGNISSAWAALKTIGEDGYMQTAEQLMNARQKIFEAVDNIPGLTVLGKPHMTSFALGSNSSEMDVLTLADMMEKKGWKMERQHKPPSIHCTLMPHHLNVIEQFIEDLIKSVKDAVEKPSSTTDGSAAIYGMIGNIPDQGLVDDVIVEFFSQLYKT